MLIFEFNNSTFSCTWMIVFLHSLTYTMTSVNLSPPSVLHCMRYWTLSSHASQLSFCVSSNPSIQNLFSRDLPSNSTNFVNLFFFQQFFFCIFNIGFALVISSSSWFCVNSRLSFDSFISVHILSKCLLAVLRLDVCYLTYNFFVSFKFL